MKTKITLIADDGKILTDGEHYGRIVYLSPEDDGSTWREIDGGDVGEEGADGAIVGA